MTVVSYSSQPRASIPTRRQRATAADMLLRELTKNVRHMRSETANALRRALRASMLQQFDRHGIDI
jgi:hypothetical protein